MATQGYEVRTLEEGSLAWVQASASGDANNFPVQGFYTGSAPASGLITYADSLGYTSGQRIAVQSDRGRPSHNKYMGTDAIQVNFGYRWTGQWPTIATAAGASVPMVHLEYRSQTPEIHATAVQVARFFNVPVLSLQFAEGEENNTLQATLQALGMEFATATLLDNHVSRI